MFAKVFNIKIYFISCTKLLITLQCTDFTFLSTKKESESNASNTAAPTVQKPVTKQPEAPQPIAEEEDDLPF